MKTNYHERKRSFLSSSKKIFALVLITATLLGQLTFAQDSTKTNPSELLRAYLDIKNALVASDPSAASIKAGQFVKTLNGIDSKVVNEGTRNAMLKHAGQMSVSKDLRVQRENFATLSANMYILAKSVKLSGEPVFYVYCPMKKAYWLSSDASIKNPYYGSAMLTCGQVTETIK